MTSQTLVQQKQVLVTPLRKQMRETGIDGDADILIAYFTRPENLEHEPAVEAVSGSSFNVIDDTLVGDVQVIAEMIAEQTGGALFSIQTEVGYPNVYDEHTALRLEVEEGARPTLMTDVAEMTEVDVSLSAFPVCGTVPQEPV